MTLAQLQSFVLVARHGSVKAAAAELEVTEPAVSVAVAALRRELGDELFVRNGRGIALTPGGRRLAALAGEILGLAEQARRSVQDAPGSARRMQVAATSIVAEHIGPLIDAFTRARLGPRDRRRARSPGDVVRRPARAPPGRHRARPAPGPERAATIASVPFLRSPADDRRRARAPAGGRARHRSGRAGARALAGRPAGARPDDDAPGCSSPATGSTRADVAAYTSHAAAVAAAAAGEGIDARAGALGDRRDAPPRRSSGSTSAGRRWSRCGTRARSGLGRALPAALALQRFATTPGGDAGDVERARRDRVGAGAARGPRDPVAVGGRGDRR